MKSFIIAIIMFAISNSVNANNMNKCISQSTGVSGFQFKNICKMNLKLHYTSGLLEKKSWKAISVKPGKTIVIRAFNDYYACPLKDANGKKITFDQTNLACEIKDEDKKTNLDGDNNSANQNSSKLEQTSNGLTMFLYRDEAHVVSLFSKASTVEEAILESFGWQVSGPIIDPVKCSSGTWFAVITDVAFHSKDWGSRPADFKAYSCGYKTAEEAFNAAFKKCDHCMEAADIIFKWGFYDSKEFTAGKWGLPGDQCRITLGTGEIFAPGSQACNVNEARRLFSSIPK